MDLEGFLLWFAGHREREREKGRDRGSGEVDHSKGTSGLVKSSGVCRLQLMRKVPREVTGSIPLFWAPLSSGWVRFRVRNGVPGILGRSC